MPGSARYGLHKASFFMPPPLSIRLTEPVVFLRDSSGTSEGRPRESRNTGQPAFVRGLVTLVLAKPTRISSIEVTLEGKSSTVWLESLSSNTARRGDNLSEKVFLTASSSLFSAKSCLSSKRSASLGPHQPEDDYLPASRSLVRSLSTQPHNAVQRNSEEYIQLIGTLSQEHTMSVVLDSVTSPPVSPLYTPQFTPQYSTLELPMISRPDTPIEYGDNSTHRSPFGIQENRPDLEATHDSTQLYVEDSVTTSTNFLGLSPLGHHNHSSSSHSSRIAFSIPSPPISRSVSRDFTQSYNRDNSPSPGSSTPRGRHSSRWSLSSMTHILKDAKEKFRSVSKESDLHRGRNPEPRRHYWDLDHEKLAGEKIQNSGGINHTNHLDSWKEFRKGKDLMFSFSPP
ncbi:hypothetical protein Clacol_002828 [Clathrus columnatus]|uniref:Uncharacterized protein n=1 Tax=Clathrus columnatus TaxID=1419009 RepID=A0AAV5A1V4_9AGAM|nr:hypothetical protein Clacol_002828 [Clathrus columnatus]